MTQKIGIIYSSVDGQTLKICEKLITIFNKENIETELYSIDEFDNELSDFHTLIIGASIRYGKHNEKIYKFIERNKEFLRDIKTAFFSVNLVARKEDKNLIDTNPYLIKFLEKTDWKPDFLEVFGGKLDYKSYSFFDKLVIKLIMKLTGGPTRTDSAIEYTKWEKVHSFGLSISEHYKATKHNIS